MKLDAEKRARIINAALLEFADHGYEYASTNRIVKASGIGKGMLFYYFNSKKELFHFLLEYSMDYITDQYLSKIDPNETDFIAKYKNAAAAKMDAFAINPYIFLFLGALHLAEYNRIPLELQERMTKIKAEGLALFEQNIDQSLFREDLPPDTVMRLIALTMSGYENEIVVRIKDKKLSSLDFDPYGVEFDQLLDLVRKIYYK